MQTLNHSHFRMILQRALFVCACAVATSGVNGQDRSSDLASTLGISFPTDSRSTVILAREGKRYAIDVEAKSIHEITSEPASQAAGRPGSGAPQASNTAASAVFAKNCAVCHGPAGKGIRAVGTPDFTDQSVQRGLSDSAISDAIHNGKGGRMPAWSGKLSESDISSLVAYVRSIPTGGAIPSGGAATATAQPATAPAPEKVMNLYEPGDDLLMSLPTGRPTAKHGLYANFTHRFAYDPAFTGTGRGEILFGLDGYAIPSFGFRYGITDRLSVSAYRSPSVILRPIQLMAGYELMNERRNAPFNLTARFSVEGQNNFSKNFTENFEAIISRSLTHRAQIYAVPTLSINDRRLVQGGFRSADIPTLPGITAFSLGVGVSVDVRPTVALLVEVIPTLANARDLGIHRPAYAFGIQKKIYRHAFTFGFSTGPGTTVSQRAGTRATFVGDPSADTPGGLFASFNLTRQIR